MDDRRFDDLTRPLGTAASRRRVLAGLAGAALALLGRRPAAVRGREGAVALGGACDADAQCNQLNQGGVPVVCRDNGIAADGPLNCCLEENAICGAGAQCCGALRCLGGVCLGQAPPGR